MYVNVFPSHIRKAALFSPSGEVSPALKTEGSVALVGCGLTLEDFDRPEPHGIYPYMSDDDAGRSDAFNRALADETVDLLWPWRGGYGCMRILEKIRFEKFGKRPYVGFSDNTAVLMAMSALGVGRPVAGVHAGKFGETVKQALPVRSLALALRPEAYELPLLKTPEMVKSGEAEGRIYAVNLATFCAMLKSRFVPELSGAILWIEDVGEPVRKIDRLLCELELSGILKGLNGLIFGAFAENDEPRLLYKLMTETALKVNGPVWICPEFGHVSPMVCVPFGRRAHMGAKGLFIKGEM